MKKEHKKGKGDPELVSLSARLNQKANLFYRLVDSDAPIVVLEDQIIIIAEFLSKIDKAICSVKSEQRNHHKPHR